MPRRQVSPNRMELMRLKNELRTARRGHRLLKDKRDGLMQRFLELLDETMAKRRQTDLLLQEASNAMAIASALIEPEVLLQTMQLRTKPLEVEASTESVMSVKVPRFHLPQLGDGGSASGAGARSGVGVGVGVASGSVDGVVGDGSALAVETDSASIFTGEVDGTGESSAIVAGQSLQYGMVHTSGDIDIAFEALAKALKPLLELASLEKTLQVLAVELENTRRRVNSLEHVMIPELEEMIKKIQLRMEENDRDSTTRLMKVKDSIVKQEILARRKASESAE